jgi:hypothetical protein
MVCLFGLLCACKGGKYTIPSSPQLFHEGIYVFNSGFGYDSFVEVALRFEDADGDIGLNESDTMYPFGMGQPAQYNLLVYYQDKKGQQWQYAKNPLLGVNDTLVLHQRIGNITPSGKNKAIQGNLTLVIPARPYTYRGDSVRFEIQLMDRALHRSKKILTPAIFLQHP